MIQKAPVDHLTGERVDPDRVNSFNEAQLTEEEKRRAALQRQLEEKDKLTRDKGLQSSSTLAERGALSATAAPAIHPDNLGAIRRQQALGEEVGRIVGAKVTPHVGSGDVQREVGNLTHGENLNLDDRRRITEAALLESRREEELRKRTAA